GCGRSSVGPSDGRTFPFDFAGGTQGWVPGFADYPPEYGPEMELVAEYRRLPATYRLNIDKGNQAQSGKEAVVIGTVGNLSGTETWELKELESAASPPLTVMPNPDGSVWLLMGTDSGFEGRTSLYYTRVSVQLTPR
ncbi:MAG TPA: hypothetical protein VF964_03580, partial [Vicinamibacteria bacterium]